MEMQIIERFNRNVDFIKPNAINEYRPIRLVYIVHMIYQFLLTYKVFLCTEQIILFY